MCADMGACAILPASVDFRDPAQRTARELSHSCGVGRIHERLRWKLEPDRQRKCGTMSTGPEQSGNRERRWRPLSSVQRRVIGVLIEKAKTTPDSYPMTLNALTAGCNQKSNRAPQMDLTPEDIEKAIEELREMGAAAEIQSGGRVSKFRHYMYDWLGVDKVELAVMAELLLRGEQTIGELRGRAARMEPIADLNALRPVLDALLEKELIISLTPPGRGQVVTHNLYTPERLEKLKQQYASSHVAAASESAPRLSQASSEHASSISVEDLEELRSEVAQLRSDIQRLSEEIERLKS